MTQRNNSDDLAERPTPTGIFHYNTTVQGWLYGQTVSELFTRDSIPELQRVIINVNIAMPHSCICATIRDSINEVIQPHDLVASKISDLIIPQ